MKGTSKPRLPHLRPVHPHLRVRGWFLSENAAMPPGQQVKVHKSASFVDILEVCKFTTFCDRKGYTRSSEYVFPRRLNYSCTQHLCTCPSTCVYTVHILVVESKRRRGHKSKLGLNPGLCEGLNQDWG